MNELNTLIEQRGISIYKVSKDTGISQSTLYDFANGRHLPKPATLQRIADYFGVPLSFFTTGEMTEKYYEDPLTAELAQKLKDDHDLRLLFSAAKDAAPETLQATYDVLLALKKREKGETD